MFSPVAFVAKELPGVGAGLVLGAFVPSILRKVKSGIVSVAKKIAAKAEVEVKKV